MEVLRKKYIWLAAGLAFFLLSFFISSYFKQLIFLGTLGVIGYFVYDALELIYLLNSRNLADMRANMEIIMQEMRINKEELVRQKLHKKTKNKYGLDLHHRQQDLFILVILEPLSITIYLAKNTMAFLFCVLKILIKNEAKKNGNRGLWIA